MKRLLVFDVDGTLIDSEKSIVRCINESSTSNGYNIGNISKYIGVKKLTEILAMCGVDEGDIGKIMENYRRCYADTFLMDTRAADRSLPVLEELQKNNELGILTFKDLKLTLEVLKAFFPQIDFKHVVCGDRPIQDKVAGLNLIIEESGRSPDQIYYIGDRAGDVKSANTVGMNAVWISSGIGNESELDFRYEFQIAGSFDDLLKIFR